MDQERLLTRLQKTAAPEKFGAGILLTPDFSGKWGNQLSSTMALTVNGSLVTGVYESAVSGGGGSIKGDLTGFVNGDLISFVVKWPSASITAWVGQLISEGGREVIVTLWHMTTNTPESEEPTGIWKSVYAGTDRFHR